MKNCLPLLFVLGVCALGTACSSFGGRDLERRPPPLADMEEPLTLLEEPDDEAERQEMQKRSFSGLIPTETGESLDEVFESAPGLGIASVVENSPAEFAGLEPGDLLLEATPEGGEPTELRWPSDWLSLEAEHAPGTRLAIIHDRAGRELETELILAPRFRRADRIATERHREEEKVGVVLRNATEVEASVAGLPPGGGAVVVGLSQKSPWRPAGVVFGDLIVSVDEAEVAHPRVVLEAIRNAEEDAELELLVRREGEILEIDAPVVKRETEFTDFTIPLLFSYESEGERSDTSLLYGLFGYESTAAEWQMTLLWFINFGGGETEELEEVDG